MKKKKKEKKKKRKERKRKRKRKQNENEPRKKMDGIIFNQYFKEWINGLFLLPRARARAHTHTHTHTQMARFFFLKKENRQNWKM